MLFSVVITALTFIGITGLTGCSTGNWYQDGHSMTAPLDDTQTSQTYRTQPFIPNLESSVPMRSANRLAGRSSGSTIIGSRRTSYVSEELWIIAKAPDAKAARSRHDDAPASGAMVTKAPQRDVFVPVPLKHTAVTARIDAYIATVDVVQQFHNPFDTKIEAAYVFPLPDNAAINEFIMTIGERRIRGIIRERAQAEKLYKDARSQGRIATLMTQERPNIFTQKLANIEPGKQIDVSIRYFQTLAYVDGWYQFEFPMVVGPRFNPPDTINTNTGIGAAPRDLPGISGQPTEVAYLRPEERSGHDVSLSLVLNPGVEIEELACVNHLVDQTVDETGRVLIQLSGRDRIPNKDFVLRYRVAGDQLKTHFLAQRDMRGGGHFTLMLYPPADTTSLQRHPMEMVFVIDASGSMQGRPFKQAQDALVHALKQLGPTDTFQIVRFSETASTFAPSPVAATDAQVRKAIGYANRLQIGGGTMMAAGMEAALRWAGDDSETDHDRLRFVCFLTDGYIGNESEVLRSMHDHLGQARVFSFGIGASPNRYLMNRMAKLGQGVAAYLALDESPEDIIDLFFDRVSKPVMRDIEIDWQGLRVADVYPSRIPDLFAGRPVVLTGRYLPGSGSGSASLETPVASITARHADRSVGLVIPTDIDHAQSHSAVANVWARARIAELNDELTLASHAETSDLKAAIRQTALDHNLMSAYTAFIAVDASGRTQGDYGVTVHVPVPVPAGVEYDTTVEPDPNGIEQ